MNGFMSQSHSKIKAHGVCVKMVETTVPVIRNTNTPKITGK